MSEMVKSSIFVGLALVLVAIAGYVQFSSSWSTETATASGIEFANLNDPTQITGLEIVRYDDTNAKLDEFEVRQVDGAWSIPSYDNYPADAENTHLAEAATALISMKVMGESVASLPTKHSEFGVVDPTEENLSRSGLGTRITLTSASGERLAQLIIGKPEGNDPSLRYVRVPGQDQVFVAKIDTSALTTNLKDWVEADLLKINTLDIASITINDYSVDEQRGTQVVHDVMKFNYDNTKPISERWSLVGAKPGETARADGLNDLTAAMTLLQIVGVEPKPADLVALLKGEGTKLGNRTQLELQERGFFIASSQLLSNEGEIIVQMNNGVVYRIQFGEVAEGAGGSSSLDSTANDAAAQVQQLNRYVFVNAFFDETFLKKPEMPEILKEGAAGTDAAAGDANAQDADLAAKKRQAEIDYNASLKEYQAKVDAGNEKASELAARFAGWYYIISDDVFNQVKVTRADVVETRIVEEQGYDLDDLQRLRRQGVDGVPGGK